MTEMNIDASGHTARSFIPRREEAGNFVPVKSAERALRLLEILASSQSRMTMTELAKATGYPKSSLHALIETLGFLGWLESDPQGSHFGLGPNALITGTAYLDRDTSLPFVYRALENLRAQSDYTFHYARLIGAHVLYLATRESPDRDRKVIRIGRVLPAHATSLGQALLAERTPDEVDALLPKKLERLTEHTIVDRVDLQKELALVRDRGWAREKEQNRMGLTCVAVTVSYRIPATDALSCSMPLGQATDEEIERVVALVRQEAQRLATELRQNGIR